MPKSRLKSLQEQQKQAEELGRFIVEQFEETKNTIQKELDSFILKYGSEGMVTDGNENLFLNKKESKEWKSSLKNDKNTFNPKWNDEIEYYKDRQRITRLESLEVQINNHIETLVNNQYIYTKGLLMKTVEETYNKANYFEMLDIGFKLNFNKLSTRKIETIVNMDYLGTSFSEKIWINKEKLILELKKVLVQGTALGHSHTLMAKELSHRMGVRGRSAKALVRTETNRVTTLTDIEYYRDTKVEEYIIDATLDDRTSEICQEMDQQVFKMSDFILGVTAPPFHTNCRTVILPILSNFDIINSDRIAKDKEGNKITVPGDWSYKDYKKEYLAA